jgi:hypothetical protein
MECQFCKNVFSSTKILTTHQKSAKYCIKIQGVKGKSFDCDFCTKNFTQKVDLQRHHTICKNKKEKVQENNYINTIKEKDKQIKEQKEQIKEQKEQIKELQNQLANIALCASTKPTYINNNNNQRINNIINNLIPITDEHLKQQAEFLTIDHIKNGIDGYVQYALDFPLKDRIICTDFSRRKIKYKDSEGNLVDDPEMSKVTQKLFKAIEEKNSILVDEYIKELQEKYNILIRNPHNDMNDEQIKDFDSTGNIILSETFKVNVQKREIKEVANGQKPEIYYEFIKDVCSKTVN